MRLRELGHAGGTGRESVQEGTARAVGKRVKNLVEAVLFSWPGHLCFNQMVDSFAGGLYTFCQPNG